MSRIPQIVLHLAGWAIFITLPILFFPGPKADVLFFFKGAGGLNTLTRDAFLIGYFYLNYHWLTVRFFFTKKYWRFTIITIGVFLFIAFTTEAVAPDEGFPMQKVNTLPDEKPGAQTPLVNPRVMPPPPMSKGLGFRAGRHALPFTLVFMFSLMLRINARLRETETARQKAEVAYLHAQINPHFLFNTLNSIYSLALQKADATAQAVVKLSNMMRYVLTDTVHERVSLAKELEYLNNYVELQRLRLPASVSLTVKMDSPQHDERIAPMLIIPFIENAFKYGVNPEQPSHISIEIKLEFQLLFCIISNQKVSSGNGNKTEVGIKNVQHRLQMLYPQKHTLALKQSEHEFAVYLSIILE
ncbi:MAG: sensor histidine kinase [Cyclobacteriaceae bacterium]|nr:sensor histidine kinase [Cyclobacteriaceae bacterium]